MNKTKIQIAQVTSYFPPHLGGMENCVKEISENLNSKGWNVSVYTSSIGRNIMRNKIKSIPIFSLRAFEFAHTPIIFTLFFRLLMLKKPTIVHVHIAQAFIPEIVYLVSKIRSIPYIVHIHLDVDESGIFGFLLAPYKNVLLSRVLRNAAKIICLSSSQGVIIKKKYNIPNKNIEIVPNGVSSIFFSKVDRREHSPFHILFVGRLAKQKNLPFLLNAITHLKQKVILDVVGSGDEKEKLEKIINNKNIQNVVFHGEKKDKDLLRFYNNANIFAITSEKEGASLAMLEAMAQGLPIVSRDVEGVRGLIKNCGILVKPSTPENFAKNLDNLLVNSSLRKNLSVNSRKKAAEYSWDKTVDKIESIYNEILKKTYAN